MADLKKTIDIVFGAVDNTGQTVKGIGKNINALSGQVSNISAPLNNVANAVLGVDAAILALGVTMTGVAVREAAQFQTAFNEISTLFSAPEQSINDFSAEIRDYAANSTQSLEIITQSVYSAISAGVDYTNSLAVVGAAEKLAVAGKAGLNDTLVSLVSTLNAYGASTDEAADYSNAFFKIVKLGQTTIPELSSSLSQVTGIAAASGVPFTDLGAAIAALTAAGAPTSQAITGIKAALSNILKPTKAASDEAERLGLKFDSAALSTKGFGGFMEDVKDRTGGSVDSMSKLFGSVEAVNAVLTLTGNGNAKFLAALQSMADGSDSLGAAFDRMNQNLDLVTQNMQNNLRLAFAGFGAQILPQFTKDVAAISQVFSSLSFSFDKTDAFNEVYDALNSLGADFEATALAIARALPEALNLVDFGGALAAWSGVGDSLGGLFDGIDFSKPEDLADVVQGLVDTIGSLGTVTEGMVDQFVPFVRGIFGAIEAFNDLDEETQKTAGATLGLGKIVDTVIPAIEIMGVAITTLGTTLSLLATKGLFDTVLGLKGIVPSFEGASKAAGKFGSALGLLGAAFAGYEIGGLIHDKFKDEIDSAADTVLGFIDDLTNFSGKGQGFENEVNRLADSFAALGIDIDKSAVNLENLEYFWASYYAAQSAATDGVDDAATSFDKLTDSQKALAQSNADLANATGSFTNGVRDSANALVEVDAETQAWSDNILALAQDQDKATTAMVTTKQVAGELDGQLSKFAASVYQAQIELDIAQAVGAVDIFKSSMDGLSDSITGSQDLLGNLVSSLANGDLDYSSAQEILRIIRAEADLKAQQIKLQNELIEAELNNINLKNQALKNGDSEIKISADGLEPELEAFMFRILERIQLRASQEQAAFLVGVT